MSYNWCHGPECHTQQTQSRVRGSGRDKVLRTIKIKWGRYNYSGDEQPNIWDYFCNHRCLMDFIRLHLTSIIAIAPRREALETPIKVESEQREGRIYSHRTGEYFLKPYKVKTITRVDNNDG